MLCVQRAVGLLGKDVAASTLHSLHELSGMPLEELVDTPDELILILRRLVGLGSVVFVSIRNELLLSSVGHTPRSGQVEGFLSALTKAKESAKAVKAGIVA